MAIAKRTGPDFLFLANGHSQKFSDLEKNKECSITFQNSSNQDWVSITGEAVTTSNEDPRIKEIWSKGTKAWFGDLGDGVHTGGPEDPRMKLIEVKSKCESCSSSSRCICWADNVGRHLLLEGFGRDAGLHQGSWCCFYDWRCGEYWRAEADDR